MNTWVNNWMAEHGLILPELAYKQLCQAVGSGRETLVPNEATITVQYKHSGGTERVAGPRLADFVRDVHALARIHPGGTLGPLVIERPVCLPRYVGPYVHAPRSFGTTEANRLWSKGLADWRKAIENDREAWELLR